ncbi:hypothetical protein V500_04629 [Pseudogymnoascus sp. VKM F-4518 (FW-2643)]|nr:hypothetical protein V500_04629 [Pseudogymnoascus sp. VKM F-4518 (FW-2643)]
MSTDLESCGPGYTLRNGECVSEVEPACEQGATFNGTVCVGSEPSCGPGTAFDGTECASIDDPICLIGLKWNGQKCISENNPTCNPRTQWDASSKECIGENPPQCPPGQRFNGERCALDSGDYMEFQYCPAGSTKHFPQAGRLGVISKWWIECSVGARRWSLMLNGRNDEMTE